MGAGDQSLEASEGATETEGEQVQLTPEQQEAVDQAVANFFGGASSADLYEGLDNAENALKYIGGLYLAAAFGAMVVGWSLGLDVVVAGCMVAGGYQAEQGEVENYAKGFARKLSYSLAFLFTGLVLAFVTIAVGILYVPSILVALQVIFVLVILYAISKVVAIRKHAVARVKADPNAYRTDAKWLHELGK